MGRKTFVEEIKEFLDLAGIDLVIRHGEKGGYYTKAFLQSNPEVDIEIQYCNTVELALDSVAWWVRKLIAERTSDVSV